MRWLVFCSEVKRQGHSDFTFIQPFWIDTSGMYWRSKVKVAAMYPLNAWVYVSDTSATVVTIEQCVDEGDWTSSAWRSYSTTTRTVTLLLVKFRYLKYFVASEKILGSSVFLTKPVSDHGIRTAAIREEERKTSLSSTGNLLFNMNVIVGETLITVMTPGCVSSRWWVILLTVLFQYLKYNCSRVLPELLPPSCSFVLVPCCSLPNVLTALWFGQSINLSVILHSSLQFLFLYFCSGSLRPFSFPLSPSTSSPLAPAGSSSNSSGLWRVCVCLCASLYVPPCVWVCCVK